MEVTIEKQMWLIEWRIEIANSPNKKNVWQKQLVRHCNVKLNEVISVNFGLLFLFIIEKGT